MRLALALALLAAACRAPDPAARPTLGLAASALPNFGLAAEGTYPLARAGSFEVDGALRVTQQFFDDELLADDGFASAGDWTQVELAGVFRRPLDERTAWHVRFGPVWYRARGAPNIVNKPGDYWGVVLGVGFRTRLTENLFMGPELLALPGALDGDWAITPQLVWGVSWAW